MENILEKSYRDLLNAGFFPEDLVSYEKERIKDFFASKPQNCQAGDYLLKDGTTLREVPSDISQIEGIWLSSTCIASPHIPDKKLNYAEAKKFCMSQRIQNFPLHLPHNNWIPMLFKERLKQAGLKEMENDYYWSSVSCILNGQKIIGACNPRQGEITFFDPMEEIHCYAILELSD